MTAVVNLRCAREDEAADLSRLTQRSKAHWGYTQAFMDACREELTVSAADIKADRRHYVVAVSGTTLAGFYSLDKMSDTEYELEALFVEPEHMGRGIGRTLLGHASDLVTARGGNRLLIQSDPHAEAFYRAAGAESIGHRESDSVPGRLLPLLVIECAKGN